MWIHEFFPSTCQTNTLLTHFNLVCRHILQGKLISGLNYCNCIHNKKVIVVIKWVVSIVHILWTLGDNNVH